MKKTDWTLTDVPPKGHEDVGCFAYDLFEIARKEKIRQEVDQRALDNYAEYRGEKQSGKKHQVMNPANLYFANIERTVNNITSRDPVGEVVDMDGETDEAEKILSSKLKKWWKESGQRMKIRNSATLMEIYGITVEKPYFDFERKYDVGIEAIDIFAFYPAPGLWESIDEDCPYVCFAYLDFVDAIEKKFNVTGVAADEAYELLGQEREMYKPPSSIPQQSGIGRYATPLSSSSITVNSVSAIDQRLQRGLVIELWIRDLSVRKEQVLTADESSDMTGELVSGEVEHPIYPDGVRKITVTKSDGKKLSAGSKDGYIVLDDSANPNINPMLDTARAKYTHPWGRFPVYTANSYRDPMSIWGFAAADQTRFMLYFINQILKKLINWTKNVMTPPLIIQKGCGITRQMVESDNDKAGRLILMPTIPNARIEFMQIPNLPQSFFIVLDKIIQLHDRIHAIEEVDRGTTPNGIIAASAIVALQEKNSVVLQSKTVSIESLAENRSKWAIGLWQNWGTDADIVSVNGEPREFVGVDYAGRKFNFMVESGSTTPRTELQEKELVMTLAQQGLLSKPYWMERLGLSNWKEEVARTSGQLVEQAMSILKDAGAPPEMLQSLYTMIQQAAQQQEQQPDIRQEAQEQQQSSKKTKEEA